MGEHVYRQFVADLAVATPRDNADTREEIIAYVHQAHAAGQYWATEVLNRWERTGAHTDYSKVHKALNPINVRNHAGRRIRKTTSYSRAMRSAESGEIVARQHMIIWDYDRNQLQLWRDDMARQAGQLDDSVCIGDQLLAAMDRHPDCATAREAWLAEGRSLSEIDLRETA